MRAKTTFGVLLAFAIGLGAVSLGAPAKAAIDPTLGFDPQADQVDEFVANAGVQGLGGAFMPDGRLLALSKTGIVTVVDVVAGTSATLFTIPNVNSTGEMGSLDIVLDPSFATNNFFYVYYMASTPATRLRISRFTFSASGAAVTASEAVIWQHPGRTSLNDVHMGGSLEIAADGKLLLSIGDGFDSAESQSLLSVYGKVLRINRDGSIPTDNPFFDGGGPNIDEIWALGLRNTFRFSVDPANGTVWAGDVGGNVDATAMEEVDIVEAGKNYGWPNCEGPVNANCPGAAGPLFSYPHVVGGSCCFNRAITGGIVYRGSRYPASMQGIYVYADYTGSVPISWIKPNATLTGVAAQGTFAASNSPQALPVWFGAGPDGHIYYISLSFAGESQLRRLRYTGTGVSNTPPTITAATASPTSGPSPLTVTFNGAATDADNDPISYSWDFGDGSPPSTVASPTKTYTAPGVYQARLSVVAAGATVRSAFVPITVGAPPTATITSPTTLTTFAAGTTITMTGVGSDPDDGALTGNSLQWEVRFTHNGHEHPVGTGTGNTFSLAVPTIGHSWEGNTGFLVRFTATDSSGLSTTATINLVPQKVNIGVATNLPSGGTVSVDGVVQNLPFTIDTLTGFQHSLSVPANPCVAGFTWQFTGWSNGAQRTQTYTVPGAPTTLTANYTATTTLCTSAFVESGGTVVFEGEDTDLRTAASGASWSTIPGTPGASAGMIQALPNADLNIADPAASPRADYRVLFATPGTYRVWLRGVGDTDADNSAHVGLNGVLATGGTAVTTVSFGTLLWTNTLHFSGGAATLTVPAPGEYTVNLWMREDGFRVDKIVLTTDSALVPTGTGPANSPRGNVPDTVRPTVASVTPANGAASVAVGTNVTVAFSEPVLNGAGITLATAAGGAPVAATASTSANSVVLTPASPLTPSTQYRVTVPTTVADAAGNTLLAPFTSTFTTAAPADTTPPTVVSVSPVDGATGVTVGAVPQIVFSEPISNPSAITLTAVAGGVSVPVTPTASGSTITLTPSAPLVSVTQYRITVPTAVTDLAGNPLGAATTTTFTTEAVVDSTPPTIVSTNPANSATGVPISATPQVVFSEPVTNVTGISLTATVGGTAVPASVATTGATVTVTPTAPLSNDTQYRLSVPSTVTDLAGNALAAPFSATFTTAPVVTGPLAYDESGGQIVFEAEGFDSNVGDAGKNWTAVNSPAGAVGSYMVALANTGALIDPGQPSPHMDYLVRFATAGTYRVWVRSLADSDNDNSIHVGLDGVASSNATLKAYGAAQWSNTGQTTAVTTLTVPSAGVHTVNVWMREDGWYVDRFLLTTSAAITPTGNGPAVSSRSSGGGGDTTPPTVASTSPLAGAAGVAVSVAPTVTFSEPVVQTGGINLVNTVTNTPVAVTRGVTGSVVTLTPAAPLANGTQYRIDVPTSVTDAAGNPLAAAFGATFTTVAAVDTTRPTVISTSPAAGATGVPLGSVAVVTFSEPVTNIGGITLAPSAGGAAVSGNRSAVGNTATFTPSAPLAASTSYSLTIPTTVTDLAGNALLTQQTVQFTTAAAGGTIAYQEAGGLVVMEAEGFDANTAAGGYRWTSVAVPAGASGSYMNTAPNTGALVDVTGLGAAPRLDYRVRFVGAGTYRVWIRSTAANDDDNSVHVGLDGTASSTSTLKTYGAVLWTNVGQGGVLTTITVPSAGVHTLNVWMREDGWTIDRIILATSAAFTPTGVGPAVSVRS